MPNLSPVWSTNENVGWQLVAAFLLCVRNLPTLWIEMVAVQGQKQCRPHETWPVPVNLSRRLSGAFLGRYTLKEAGA